MSVNIFPYMGLMWPSPWALRSLLLLLLALESVYVSLSAWQWALLRLSVLVSVYVSLSA